MIDGTLEAVTTFRNASTGLPEDLSGVTFGNNGFWYRFQDSANLGADSSGTGNDATLNNIDASNQSTDYPS